MSFKIIQIFMFSLLFLNSCLNKNKWIGNGFVTEHPKLNINSILNESGIKYYTYNSYLLDSKVGLWLDSRFINKMQNSNSEYLKYMNSKYKLLSKEIECYNFESSNNIYHFLILNKLNTKIKSKTNFNLSENLGEWKLVVDSVYVHLISQSNSNRKFTYIISQDIKIYKTVREYKNYLLNIGRLFIDSYEDSVAINSYHKFNNSLNYFSGKSFEQAYNYLTPIHQLNILFNNYDLIDTLEFLESKGLWLSFIGDYKNVYKSIVPYQSVLNEFNNTQFKYKLPFLETSYFDNEIRNILDSNQIIMFNEEHLDPMSRKLLTKYLNLFSKYGYKYIAIEGINQYIDWKTFERKDIDQKIGVYTSDPSFANLIRASIGNKLDIVAYENSSTCDTCKSNESKSRFREMEQAKNIYKILQSDPKAKIIIFGGRGHISKRIGAITMANYLKKLSNIDPISINCNYFRPYNFNNNTSLLFNWLKKSKNGTLLVRNTLNDNYVNSGYDYFLYSDEFENPDFVVSGMIKAHIN